MRIVRWRKKTKPQLRYKINEQITVPEVRVIDEEDKHLGILKTGEALRIARERELDLVEIRPKDQPPVAKILDFGQLRYAKEKEARQQKAKLKRVEVKGVRLSFRIGKHDLEFRKNQALKFLETGNKVKIELPLRGLERRKPEMARQIINNFVKEIESLGKPIKIEQPLVRQANKLSIIIAPG